MKKFVIVLLVLSVFMFHAGTEVAAAGTNWITAMNISLHKVGKVGKVGTGTYADEIVICVDITGGGQIIAVDSVTLGLIPQANLYAIKMKAGGKLYYYRTKRLESHFFAGFKSGIRTYYCDAKVTASHNQGPPPGQGMSDTRTATELQWYEANNPQGLPTIPVLNFPVPNFPVP